MFFMDSLFEHQLHIPQHIAFSEEERHISYHDFLLQASQISTLLHHHDISHGDRVAILLPRGIDAALSIYASLFTGAAYVPLDIQNPTARLNYIVNDVQPSCVIGAGLRPEWLDEKLQWFDFNSLPSHPVTEVKPAPMHHDKENIAAILYTSGSTGKPKGVAISCRAIQAFVSWSSDVFDLNKSDHIASLAPFHFDLSLFDLFTSISNGSSTHFVPQKLTMMPKKLIDWLTFKSITTWYTVPSILSFLTLRGGLNSTSLPSLKRILFAGEVFPLPNLIKLTKSLPHIDLYNLFGPTETNVCTFWKVQPNILHQLDTIPIGIAACAAQLSITEEELLVQGPCLMSGYWLNGALQKNTHTWHHTGDKVSQNSDQQYLYHGRMDRMIKSSGYRIEPAEIEHHINQFEGVEESVVIGENDAISGQRLIAVMAGKDINMQALRTHLKNNIAAYMQPYRFLQLDSLPHLSNGKLDFQHLMQQLSDSK